jgi:hypothetical protein
LTAVNAARRSVQVTALRNEFSDRVEICGANAGLHLLAWGEGIRRLATALA